MKTRLALLLLAALALAGCETVSVQKREMKITTPLFSYESKTEGFSGSQAATPAPSPDSASPDLAK